ncbi:MAG: HD-GYP domain-containing protein [Planctomycetes bacterium]|nr:HD-GYP domain-containing protein [Planctomycetota bacterium]
MFLTRPVAEDEDFSGPARRLGMEPGELREWSRRQKPWSAETLKQITGLVLDNAQAEMRLRALQEEAEKLSVNLASTYEEISLLYRLTQNLSLSKSDKELGRIALEWLGEVVPAAGLAIQLTPSPGDGKSTVRFGGGEPAFLVSGDCPIDEAEFSKLIDHLVVRQVGFDRLGATGSASACLDATPAKPVAPNKPTYQFPLGGPLEAGGPHRPIVVNRPIAERPDWPCPRVRQLIAVALTEGENTFGWMAALNHVDDAEFGTVEANLLSSVAAILGIHGGNIELYRQQSELLERIIHSLSSAIDAKDPYTRGHSDRVARVAVRLAEEMGCDAEMLKTIYLAGLLHDVGKIGVEDCILRKAGKLSDEEYEHIKQHAEIGHRILHDLSKLENVLPVVLHHHEAWDGEGYPQRLDAERIPPAARIVAVADAFDAMSSDRPYRKGMSDERVDEILRAGAGRQWDPAVIDAFFRSSDDLRRLCRQTQ